MNNKDSTMEAKQKYFKLFLDYGELFSMMHPGQIGKLIRAIMKYGIDGTIPELDDELMMSFLMMKELSDQEAERYEKRCRQNSINAKKRFERKIPLLEDVKKYFEERSLKSDPEYFFDYYQARGWQANNQQIVDWKALARAWEKYDKKNEKKDDISSEVLKYIDTEDAE